MANLKKNGNLSGAVGPLVFVNDDGRVYVRSKAHSVKQSVSSKASAALFGQVSAREKRFRLQLLREMGLPAPQYFAAKHRARLQKTVLPDAGAASIPLFGNPKALEGFDFNPKLQWLQCTNFYAEFKTDDANALQVSLPALHWAKEIRPPKDSTSAILTLYAVAADLDDPSVPVKLVSRWETEINRYSAAPAAEWEIPTDTSGKWLLIVACLRFKENLNSLHASKSFAASYLWAGHTAM